MQKLTTYLLYLAAPMLFLIPTLGHAHTLMAGPGDDPKQWIFFYQQFAHCITHPTNPWYTQQLWAPHGLSLAWATCTPLLCLLATPITLLFGPWTAYNAMAYATITANAAAAYALAKTLNARHWPATAAGLLVAFSPFALTELMGRPCVYTTWPITLGLAAYALYANQERTTPWFTCAATAAMTAQLYISTETALSATLIAGLTIAIMATDPTARKTIRNTLPGLLAATAATAALAAPYTLPMLLLPHPHGWIFDPDACAADLLNFILPSPTQAIGGKFLQGITKCWQTIFQEQDAYIGIPLLATATYLLYKNRTSTAAKTITAAGTTAALLAMGPHLEIAGIVTQIPLPFKLFTNLPLADKLIPIRLAQYSTLAAITAAAVYWPKTTHHNWNKTTGTGLLIALSLCPQSKTPYWTYTPNNPSFFTTNTYRDYIVPNQIIMILPGTAEGNGALFCAEDHFYWRDAAGWIGAATQHPLYKNWLPPKQFPAWLDRHHTHTVIVPLKWIHRERPFTRTLQPICKTDGVEIYHKRPTPENP